MQSFSLTQTPHTHLHYTNTPALHTHTLALHTHTPALHTDFCITYTHASPALHTHTNTSLLYTHTTHINAFSTHPHHTHAIRAFHNYTPQAYTKYRNAYTTHHTSTHTHTQSKCKKVIHTFILYRIKNICLLDCSAKPKLLNPSFTLLYPLFTDNAKPFSDL